MLSRFVILLLISTLTMSGSPRVPVANTDTAALDISISSPLIVMKAGENRTTYVNVTMAGANDTVILSYSVNQPHVLGILFTPPNATLQSGEYFGSAMDIFSSNYAEEGDYSITISAFGVGSHLSNSTVLNVMLTTSIDLDATSLVVTPPSPKENDEAEFRAWVMNRGYRPVYNIQTRFILDTQIPENRTIDLIPAGQSVSVSVEWSPVTKGQHNLTFVVDPDDLIRETTKENNAKMLAFEAEAQTFSVTVQIEGLEHGQASLCVNNTCRFTGPGIWSDTFEVGTTVTIKLDQNVTVAEDTMYQTDDCYWPSINRTTVLSVLYYPVFRLYVDSQPVSIVQIVGSGWYPKGTHIDLLADPTKDVNDNVLVKFEYWLVGSQRISSNFLPYTVQAPAHLTAFYSYFYRVTLRSEYGEPRITQWSQGACDQYWCKNGTRIEWSISEKEVAAEGPLGTLGFQLRPNATSGHLTVTAPVAILVDWKIDWFSSILGLFVIFGIPTIIATAVVGLLRKRIRRRFEALG